ncbi:hypothetical protein Hte_007638 [Hypoxylon texense]
MCKQWNSSLSSCGHEGGWAMEDCQSQCRKYVLQPGRCPTQKKTLCVSCWADASPLYHEYMTKRYVDTTTARPGDRELRAMHICLMNNADVSRRNKDQIHKRIMDQWKKHGTKAELDEELISAGCTPEVVCSASDALTQTLMSDTSLNDDDILSLYKVLKSMPGSNKRDPAP